ncbi:MAG: FprA family A-type flavoprotein [Rikenellaceae bacterium]
MIQDLTDKIKYIGVDDHDVDLFESQYTVDEGMCYNSYLILDDKIALMDTVDGSKSEEWLERLEAALDGRTPDYLVVTHTEPDHAASIGVALEKYPQMMVVGNAKTFTMISNFFANDLTDRTVVVKEGDTLELGYHTLKFIMAPMIHWPEVMVAYESSEKILFSADAFGKFGASDWDQSEGWTCEARRYYYNIVGKYGLQVQQLLKKLSGVEVNIIAPLHGDPISEDIAYYVKMYDMWSRYQFEDEGVMIAYASIHGNTRQAAEEMAEVLKGAGAKCVKLFDLARLDQSFCVEDAFQTQHLILASASYDNGLFPPMEHFLHHLASKGYQGRRVALIENGSWAPVAGKLMRAQLEKMKNIEIYDDTLTILSTLKPSQHEQMETMAKWILRE